MNNKQLVLTEEDLHLLVEDAVKMYLTEGDLEEGWWGGVQNAWYGAKGGNFNLKTNYRVGNWASSFNKYAQQAQSAIAEMQQIATSSNNKPIATSLGQIAKQMQKVADGFNQMARNVARPQQPDTTVKNPWAKPKTPRAPRANQNVTGAAASGVGATTPAQTGGRRRTAAAGGV
jgi:hypothetical protein